MSRKWLALCAGTLLTTSLLTGLVTSQAIADTPPTTDGYTVLLEDDFNGPAGSLPNPELWTEIIGNKYPENGAPPAFGTWEVENNTADPANVSLDGNGNLVITALRDGSHNDPKSGWTSARVESKQANLKAPAGGTMKAEYRFQLPDRPGAQGLGYWPAIWMYPGTLRQDRMSWPRGCEFDLVENVQSREDELWNVVHCKRDSQPYSWAGSFDEPTGIPNNGKAQCQPESCQKAMHTGTFIWDRSGQYPVLSWYLDGVKTFEVSPTPEFIAQRKETLKDYPALVALQDNLPDDWATMDEHDGFAFIMNLAMGGAFPDSRNYGGGPTDATFPGGQLIVDFVKVSVSAGNGSQPTPTVPSTPAPSSPPATTEAPPATTTAAPTTAPPATATAPTPPTPAAPTTGATSFKNGGSLKISAVDFGSTPLKRLILKLRTSAPAGVSGSLVVHLDSATGPVVGTPQSIGFGFHTEWFDLPQDTTATGVHDVWITAESGQPLDFAEVAGVTIG